MSDTKYVLRIITFLYVLLASVSLAHCQQIPKYFIGGEEWTVRYFNSEFGSPFYESYNVKYKIGHDTIINDTAYQTLHIYGGLQFVRNKESNIVTDTITPFGYLRQDGRKLFYRGKRTPLYSNSFNSGNSANLPELLLMDANIKVGDTLKYAAYITNFRTIVISRIDSIALKHQITGDTFYLRVFKDDNRFEYIEGGGINNGSQSLISCGIIENHNTSPDNFHTACYFNPNWAFLDNSRQFEYCELPLGLAERNKKNQIKVYPNPSTDLIYLELPIKSHEPSRVQVFDIAGQCILQQELQVADGKYYISLQGLSSGVYQLCVSSGVDVFYSPVFLSE